MLSVQEATELVRNRCQRDWVAWALGRGNWPIRINLGSPRGPEFDRNSTPAQLWAAAWDAARREGIPGTVRTAPRRVRGLGTHELPTHWELADPIQALSVAPALAAQYNRAHARFMTAVEMPEVAWDSLEAIPLRSAKTIAELDDTDWLNATTTITHIAAGPGEALILRQLAVPGVHTKWIEDNAALLAAMLGIPPSPDDPRKRLEDHIGLIAHQAPVDVYLACPLLKSAAAGMERFSASVPTLNASSLTPQTVLIVENRKLGHSLNFKLQGMAVVYGLGAGVTRIVGSRWLEEAKAVLYWGDVDRRGLAILAALRRAGVPALSLMMDEQTLSSYHAHQHDSVRDQALNNDEVPEGLYGAEHALYEYLNREHRMSGRELQLEQEHIPITDALAAIDALLAQA